MPWRGETDGLKPPARVDVGSRGAPIDLDTNFFPVTVRNKKALIVHYEVCLRRHTKEAILPRRMKMEIFEKMKKIYQHAFKKCPLAYDSEKNAYSVGLLPVFEKVKGRKEFEVDIEDFDGKMTRFTMSLMVKNTANLEELMEALHYTGGRQKSLPTSLFQMIEVMFRHYRAIKYELVGRRNFFPTSGEFGNPYPIGCGKVGVVGFFGSLRPASWKDGSLLLNLDVAHTAFYMEQPLLDFIEAFMNFKDEDFHRPLEPFKRSRLVRELNNLRVQVTHSNIPRTYKIIDVSPLGSNKQTFPLKDEDTGNTFQCTIENYFRNTFGRKLKFPRLNCIQVAPADRNVFLPIECCKICKGQRVNRKLSDKETAQFIRTTAVPPATRKMQICNIHRSNDFTDDPMLENLKFAIADTPLQMKGRILPVPELMMDQPVIPKEGVWDIKRRSFYRGSEIRSWAVLNYNVRNVNDYQVNDFIKKMVQMSRERGMTFHRPHSVTSSQKPNPEQDIHTLKKTYPDIQMILIVLGRGDDLYARVKRIGDIEVGVLTQCIQAVNVTQVKIPTLANILLKINAKMGGINNVISKTGNPVILERPVMIMGADVNHPSAGDTISPSMAAVVASFDRFASRYAVEVRPQQHRVEIIQDLKNMTRNLLIAFHHNTRGCKPERIVMYRDGVSESQFMEVLAYEMKAMRAACSELDQNYQPGITFLVVQKRHHTRLFCSDKDGVGKCKNVPPGTVVDTAITHPNERDFYLCSHKGIQGTSKPTHYHVLWDDNDITMDDLQTLTYSLCHLYSRCTRSVSLPSPAYYAHLAAFRAKVHISDLFETDEESKDAVTQAEVREAATVESKDSLSKKFYYV